MKKIYESLCIGFLALGLTVGSVCYDYSRNDISESEIIVLSEVEETIEPEASIESMQRDIVSTGINDLPTLEITQNYILTEEEIELIALVTMAEAEGESEYGKRLVIDVILNRMEHETKFGNTIHDVIYAPGQFSSMWNGRVDRCYVKEDICSLVREELLFRTNNEVLYFRTNYYFSWATPVLQEGNHCFSK